MRRFSARPASDALSATGSSAPKPRAVRRTSGKSSARRASRTASARASLRVRLASAVPCESVWPPISKSAPGQPRSTSAIAAMTPLLSGTMVAEPAANWMLSESRMALIWSAQISGRGRAAWAAAAAAAKLKLTSITAASPTLAVSSVRTLSVTSGSSPQPSSAT